MGKYIWKEFVIAIYIFGGCYLLSQSENKIDKKDKGFAIYLPVQSLSPTKMPRVKLSNIRLEGSPIISVYDIIYYKKKSHEIKLTASAYEKIMQIEVSLYGTVFVVCMRLNPVYLGAFWTPVSSMV